MEAGRKRVIMPLLLCCQAAVLLIVAGLESGHGSHPATGLGDVTAAYLAGRATLTPAALGELAASAVAVMIPVAGALYLGREGGRGVGNWWFLLTVPALIGNFFDFFVGHLVFMLLFLVLAYLSYRPTASSWKWGAAAGTFIAVFYASDGTGDLIRGGPWNVTGATLSSLQVTRTLWGLLAFTSDLMVMMALLPLVHTLFVARRTALTAVLGLGVSLAIVPRLVFLPVVGFQTVFSGWVSVLASLGPAVALLAIPLVMTASRSDPASQPVT